MMEDPKMRTAACFLAFFAVAALSCATGAQEKEMIFASEIKQDDKVKLDWVWTMYLAEPNLYAVSHRDGDINIFDVSRKPDGPEFLAKIDLNSDLGCPARHLNAFIALSSRNIVYATGDWTHSKGNQDSIGLSWYQINPSNGESKKLGGIKYDAAMLHQSPKADMLYASCYYSNSVRMLELAADGTPSDAGEIKGEGLKWGLAISPDGKMACSMDSSKIGLMKIAADGKLSPPKAVEIPDKTSFEPRYSCLAFSPDGKHLYVSAGNNGQGALWIFEVDSSKAELEYKEKISEKDMFSMTCLEFSPCGRFGYFSTGPEQPGCKTGWLRRDPATGKLSFGGKADKANPAWQLAYHSKGKTLYLGSDWNGKSFKVFRTGH